MGKIPAILDGLATLRSKKITICLILQSLAQLDAIYGTHERKIISDTCGYKAVLSATDAETQEYFSRIVGMYEREETIYTEGESYKLSAIPEGHSRARNRHLAEKRIIRPEEFAVLKDIVLLSPFGYYRVSKAPYYEEELFLDDDHDYSPRSNPKSKRTAAALSILLGNFGAHFFYLGRPVRGTLRICLIVAILIFIHSLPERNMIIAILFIFGGWYDARRIFNGKLTAANGQPLK